MENTINVYKIDWTSAENATAVSTSTVDQLILEMFKEKHPDIVQKLHELLEVSDDEQN